MDTGSSPLRTVRELQPGEREKILKAIEEGATNEAIVQTFNLQLQTAVALRAVVSRKKNAASLPEAVAAPVDDLVSLVTAYRNLSPEEPQRLQQLNLLRERFAGSIEELLAMADSLRPPSSTDSVTLPVPLTTSVGEQYENDTKARWFREALGFTVKNSTPEWRAQATVVSLTGPRCLRMPEWLAAGYREENVIAVEGGSREEQSVFRETMTRYPKARAYTGKLEDLLKEEQGPYGVLDFDWTGPISDAYVDLCQNTSCRFLLANVLGRRERPEHSATLRKMFSLLDDTMYRLLQERFKMEHANMKGDRVAYQRALDAVMKIAEKNAEVQEHAELSEARMNALSMMLVGSVGVSLSARQFPGIVGNDVSCSALGEAAYMIRESTFLWSQLLKKFLASHVWDSKVKEDMNVFVNLLHTGITGMPRVKQLRKLKYRSEQSGSPYYSIFAELLPIHPEFSAFKDAFNFGSTSLEAILKGGRQYGFSRRKSVLLGGIVPNKVMGRGDTICFTPQSKYQRYARPIAEIKAGTLLDQTNAFRAWENKYPLTFVDAQAKVPWEVLE